MGLSSKAAVAGAVAVAAAYFVLTAYLAPQSYLAALAPPRPAPAVTEVSLSGQKIALGDGFTLRVSATNQGEHADRMIVSVAFPNATSTNVATVREHDFKQTPVFIERGRSIGAGYTGPQRTVAAQYPAVEAYSSPWEPGESFSIDMSVRPEKEGRFVVFVKAVGLPHNGDQSHYPQVGVIDQQDEYVSVYEVDVTKA